MHKIDKILEIPEGRRLEFKEDLPGKAELAKTVISFANDAGGEIYFGIKDNPREVVGIKEDMLLPLEEKIANTIHDNCEPTILPDISFIQYKNKHIIKVIIYKGSIPPYHLKKKNIQNGTYIRIGSTNRLASPEIIAELERHKSNVSFDAEISFEKSAGDLDITSIKNLFYEKTNTKLSVQTLRKLNLIQVEQGKSYPVNALMLLSDDNIRQKLFPYAKIECARFKGITPGNFIDQKTITGNIALQAENCYQFILRHISQGSTDYKGVFRNDRWEYPVVAIREVIRNAVIHRNYSLSGKDIKVAVFDDKIEISSPGTLPPTVDFSDMESGQSDIRNKILAPVFKRLGIIEQWGNGLKLIAEDLKKYPEIKFQWNEPAMAFRVAFIKKYFKQTDISDQVGDQVSDQVSAIIRFCLAPKSRKEILNYIGYKNHFDNYKRHLEPLIKNGLIEMTRPNTPRSKNQKYITTKYGVQKLSA